MRIGVVGAGAIGGLLGVRLAQAGQVVTLVDRGPRLAAMKKHGLKLLMADGTEHLLKDTRATDDFKAAGCQDVVILAVKAHHIEAVAPKLSPMFGPATSVVTVQNGIPWWYFYKHGGEFDALRLRSLDPRGVIEANIDVDRIIGGIAYPLAEVAAPGVVRHVEGDRFLVGELDGSKTDRVRTVADALTGAGFKSTVVRDIRSNIWLKAWGSLSFNPVSALTGALLGDICRFRETRELAERMMMEAAEVAEKLGVTIPLTIEKRIAGAERVGDHKTSMLQDVEAGQPLEIEALLGSVLELARLTNIATPSIDAVYACTKLLDKTVAVDWHAIAP